MAQWYETAYGLQYADPEDVASWGGGTLVPSYTSAQGEQYQFTPGLIGREDWQAPSATVPSGSYLLELLDKQASGQPLSLADQSKLEEVLRGSAVPTRDWRAMMMPGSPDYQDTDRARYPGITDPDYLAMVQQVHAAAQQGDPQARALLPELRKFQEFATYNATRKEDTFSPLGDPFFGALGILGLGASAGAIAPLFAGGASLGTTLGSLGALAGTAGQGASVLGEALDVPGLRQAGGYLGALGGLAGGFGGLANLWGTGVQSLSDAAKLAQSAGRITGAVGRASGSDVLGQASRYLGYAGQLGNVGSGLLPESFTDWSGTNSPLASNVAPTIDWKESSAPLTPQDWSTERGGGPMADFSYDDFIGWGTPNAGDPWNSPMPADTPGWEEFTGWGEPNDQPWNSPMPADTEGGGGSWLSGLLGGAGGLAKSLFGGAGGGIAGPLLSSLGSLGGGAIGSNAANEAARLQAAATQRGLDIQQAMWLSNLERQQPWLDAGRSALAQLQGGAGQQAPAFNQPGLPGTQPFQYNGPGMPGTGFQYTGAGMPSTGFQYSGPGMPATGFQYGGPGMPTQDFTAPTWDELKARDPGIQARLAEAQKAIETSAAARGMTMSGSTLGALQRQSQTLAANEYAPAYQRALGEYQQEYGQDWQRQQEAYQRQRAENELIYGRGYQQQGDIYGRQLAENQLGYNRQWQQQMTDYERQLAQNQLGYGRGMEQYKLGYGQQAALNEQDYARQQALYQQQYQQMVDAYNAQRLAQQTQFNQLGTLAGYGSTAVNQLGTAGQNNATQMASLLGNLGTAQGAGSIGNALSWQKAIGGVGNQLPSILAGLNA